MLQTALQTDIHLFVTETCKTVHFTCASTRSVDLCFHLYQSDKVFRFSWIYFMGTSNWCIQEPLPLKIDSAIVKHRACATGSILSRPRVNFPRKIIKTGNNLCVQKWKRSDKTVEGKKWREKGNLGLLGLKVSFLITRYSVHIPFCCTLNQKFMHVRV